MSRSPISTSRDIGMALLQGLGLSGNRVLKVSLDLTDHIAKVHVTYAVPAHVGAALAKTVEQFELVELRGTHAATVASGAPDGVGSQKVEEKF